MATHVEMKAGYQLQDLKEQDLVSDELGGAVATQRVWMDVHEQAVLWPPEMDEKRSQWAEMPNTCGSE